MRPITSAVAALVALLLAAPALANDPPDAWVTVSANIALLTTPGLTATGIDVDTVDGLVTLQGTVPTERQKRWASDVVGDVDGVASVQNLLQVVAPTREHLVEVSDDHIQARIEEQLAARSWSDGTDVEVESVTAGAVLLSGYAAELGDVLLAIETAFDVPGVDRVASEIETPVPSHRDS